MKSLIDLNYIENVFNNYYNIIRLINIKFRILYMDNKIKNLYVKLFYKSCLYFKKKILYRKNYLFKICKISFFWGGGYILR